MGGGQFVCVGAERDNKLRVAPVNTSSSYVTDPSHVSDTFRLRNKNIQYHLPRSALFYLLAFKTLQHTVSKTPQHDIAVVMDGFNTKPGNNNKDLERLIGRLDLRF